MNTAPAVILLAVLLGLPARPAAAQGKDEKGPVIPLPPKVRQALEKYLGGDVVGAPVPAPVMGHPSGIFRLERGDRLQQRVVYGKEKGQTCIATVHRVDRPGESAVSWRFDNGLGSVLLGRLDEQTGELAVYASDNLNRGIVSRFTPAEPGIFDGMRPQQSVERRIDVAVYDLAAPDGKPKHRGHLDVTLTYVGAYEVSVPAGRFEASLFSWAYKGSVGPASVEDDQYWFIAPDFGTVAVVHRTDISAFIYQQHVKTAVVTLKRE